jgi:predicted MFS family arabinose efflux permease
MFFTYGFVMMDRLSIMYLFPFIAPDLKLNNSEIGMSVSILSICWAISGWVFSSISDIFGSKKKILVIFILLFSLASVSSGFATTFTSLLIARALMGIAEGPVLPIVSTSVIAGSTPSRRGFNMGVVQGATALLGTILAPLIVIAIAETSNWRNSFYILAIPGILIAFVLMKWMKEPVFSSTVVRDVHHRPSLTDYKKAFQHRNIWLCAIISIGFMTWLFAFTAFAPTFLVTTYKFTPGQTSLIMSSMGLGGFVWGVLLPKLSDRVGRKPIMIIFGFIAALTPIVLAELHTSYITLLFLTFFLSVAQGYAPLFMSVIPAESAPKEFVTTAMSMIIFIGEIVGGTIVPTAAGALADKVSMTAPFWMAAGGSFLVFLVSIALVETAPSKVEKGAELMNEQSLNLY